MSQTHKVQGPPWGATGKVAGSPQYEIVVTASEIIGPRGCGVVKLGDEFSVVGPRLKVDPLKMKGEICIPALHSIFHTIQTMRHGVEFNWSDRPDRCFQCCPDPDGLVVFELKRGKMLEM